MAGTAESNITVLSSSTEVVAGDQRTILIITNFADKSTRVTASDLETVMFTGGPNPGRSVDGIYRESSFGNVSFSGTVAGPYTIAASALDPCQPDNWWAPANAAATADGFDLAVYPRRVYVMPGNVNCGFGGISDLGVTPSRSIVFMDSAEFGLPVDLFAHELGHALGMHHATTPGNEYGDLSDVMGNGGLDLPRQNNAPHKIQMGWLPPSQAGTITQSGTYTIAALETDPATAGTPQVLVLAKPDTNDFYYVSYRVGTGLDAQLSCCGYLNRLSVHRWDAASVNIERTLLVATVTDSGAFTDATNGITVTLTSRTDASAVVRVQLTGSACTPAALSMTMTPPSQTGVPGTAVGYDIALVNNDAAGCPSTVLSLADTIPPGWTGSLSQASLVLAPGSTGRATLTLTPSSTASVGTYTSTVHVGDVAVPVHTTSMTAALSVVPPCTSTPVVTVSPASQTTFAGTTLNYSATITNGDRSGCSAANFTFTLWAPAGWTSMPASATLTLAAGASEIVTFSITSPLGSPVGTYGIWANVSDGSNPAHSAAAAATYNIQADAIAPTAPAGLLATVRRRQVSLVWQRSSDNVGVAGYYVLRDGAVIGTTTALGWVDATVTTATYTYGVVAYDAAGNLSMPSNSAIVKIAKGK